jgi:hypothetical protein
MITFYDHLLRLANLKGYDMEVIVLLKFEVDSERVKEGSDTNDDVKAKVRYSIADIIGKTVVQDKRIVLLSSALLSEVGDNTLQIVPSNKVIEKPEPDIKIQ